jgi:bifunctional non-homologous end joining protein LigD
MAEQVQVNGITVQLSHTDKVLFPGDDISKGDLIAYYESVAGPMLPQLADRPVSMARFPDGIKGERVLQKNAPGYFPGWVRRAEVPKQGGTVWHVICDSQATLVYLANQACIELHAFLSKLDKLDNPDQLIFDLDPPDGRSFDRVRDCAFLVRGLLEDELGMTTFVKTTGGDGLHVHLPLDRSGDFEAARGLAREAAALLAARHPDLMTTQQRKDSRGDRVYLDMMRNGYAQTAVAPYSVRARPGAPVATPLGWQELDDGRLTPGRFTIATVPGRLAAMNGNENPWAGLARRRYSVSAAAARLARLERPRRPAR